MMQAQRPNDGLYDARMHRQSGRQASPALSLHPHMTRLRCPADRHGVPLLARPPLNIMVLMFL